MASWMAFQMAFRELWKTTVIQRPGFRTAAVRLEAALHEALVVGDVLALGTVDDGLGVGARAGAVPGLDDVVQVGVEDVLAEGWVGEHVVDGVVGEAIDAAVGG